MATALKLKNDIKKLKAAINSKATPKSFLPKLKSQLEKAEKEYTAARAGKKPSAKTTKETQSTLSRLQKLIKGKKYGAYKGAGVDLEKDADRPAKHSGKRKSKSGNTYYEYRANRIDIKQPPKRYPKLEDGGYMEKGGRLDSVIDNIVSTALKQIDKAENSAEDFQYLLNGVIRKLQGFSKKAEGGYMAEGGEMHRADHFKDGGKVFSETELKEILDEGLTHLYQGLNQVDLAMRYLEVKGQGGMKSALAEKLKIQGLKDSMLAIDEYITKK